MKIQMISTCFSRQKFIDKGIGHSPLKTSSEINDMYILQNMNENIYIYRFYGLVFDMIENQENAVVNIEDDVKHSSIRVSFLIYFDKQMLIEVTNIII